MKRDDSKITRATAADDAKARRLVRSIDEKLKTDDQATLLLEASGFKMYREIKKAARKNKVPIGWEPWYKDDAINFEVIRQNMTVQ